MIHVRNEKEIDILRRVCRINAEAMAVARDSIKPGVTTGDVSEKAREYIESQGGKAAFLGYNGYPGAICISIDDEVVHGIPGDRIIEEGNLVKLDVGTCKDGFYGDMARTYAVGDVSEEALRLAEETKNSFFAGVEYVRDGNRIGDIGNGVQTYAEALGYGVVRALVGHGIGRNLHEDPQIPNFGRPHVGPKLKSGMVLAIEPMINAGTWEVETIEDNWTVVTADGALSAHYENTCVVRDDHAEILTLMDGE